MKRLLSLILAGLMATTVLLTASCNVSLNSGDNNPSGAGSGKGDDWDLSRFKDIRLDEGTEVHIMSRAFHRHADELTVDVEDGKEPTDFILASVYKRQRQVEDILGVKIVNHKVNDWDEHGASDLIRSIVASDDNTYDIYAASYYSTSLLAAEGLFDDLYDIENLDTSRGYWSNYYIEKSQIGKKLYTITGDIATSALRFLFVTFFNKTLIADYHIEDPYAMVSGGTWTYDKMYSIIKDIYKDENGNGEQDAEDFYGLGLNNYLGVDAYTSAFNIPVMTINSDKQAEICINYEKYANVVERLYKLFWQTTGVLNGQDPQGIADLFAARRFVFSQSWLYNCESYAMRDMKDDYGIIPYPKYDENQADYYSFGHDQITVFAMPVSATRTAAAGAVLEVMCAASRDTTIDQYYELALKGRFARDSESTIMLDLIRKNFLLDTGWIYCESTNLMSRMLRTLIEGKTKSFAQYYAKYQSKFEESVRKLNEKFEKLE